MRYMKYLALLSVLALPLMVAPASQAQVGVGIAVGPGYVGGPPVCSYGYYGYYPYACAPYGFYGPDWFVGGVFVGAGPWFHGPAWIGRWGVAYGWRGVPGWGYGRGFYGHYYGRGPVFAGRAYVGHPVGGFHGGAGFRGGYHGGGGFHGGFHGGGHR